MLPPDWNRVDSEWDRKRFPSAAKPRTATTTTAVALPMANTGRRLISGAIMAASTTNETMAATQAPRAEVRSSSTRMMMAITPAAARHHQRFVLKPSATTTGRIMAR